MSWEEWLGSKWVNGVGEVGFCVWESVWDVIMDTMIIASEMG